MARKIFKNTPTHIKIFLIVILVLSFGFYTNIFAVVSLPPDPGGYLPGEVLDPGCTPGDTSYDCIVKMSTGGSSLWNQSGNDVYYNTGLVGIGTNTPQAMLDIKLKSTITYNQEFYEDDGNNDSLDDATYSGTYTGIIPNLVVVFITSEGTPDTFGYMDMNGDCGPNGGIPITGGPQLICDGVSITFGATTGHTADDGWVYSIGQFLNPISISDELGNNYFSFDISSSNLFIAKNAGDSAISVSNSNFIGSGAGANTTNVSNSNFIGSGAGANTTNVSNSNFLGGGAGYEATNAQNSNFIGFSSGYAAAAASSSNFIGDFAGREATNAQNSNFLGGTAGYQATNAEYSNFLGRSAGYKATNAEHSNFLGYYAGGGATSAEYSNFLGYNTGYLATNAGNSNFLGYHTGFRAVNASNSIFIGQSAGYYDIVNNTNNIEDFSILLGKSTSTGGFSNSIAIGGSATNTASNQFMIGSATRPIDTTRWNGSASTQCTLTTGTGIACTSDENLKTNISDLDTGTLDKLIKVRTVNFNWSEGDSNKNNIGFLAQDLENYFPEMVSTDREGYKSVYYANMTPIIVEAIREMNLKLEDLSLSNKKLEESFVSVVKKFFEEKIIFIKELIVDTLRINGDVCVDDV